MREALMRKYNQNTVAFLTMIQQVDSKICIMWHRCKLEIERLAHSQIFRSDVHVN